jgi:hypothetical protein
MRGILVCLALEDMFYSCLYFDYQQENQCIISNFDLGKIKIGKN